LAHPVNSPPFRTALMITVTRRPRRARARCLFAPNNQRG